MTENIEPPITEEPSNTLFKKMPKLLDLPQAMCLIAVDGDLIQAVKLKANGEVKNKTASGVIDWLIHEFLKEKG